MSELRLLFPFGSPGTGNYSLDSPCNFLTPRLWFGKTLNLQSDYNHKLDES